MSDVVMTFDLSLRVLVDVERRELRFEAGDVADPSAPTLIELDGKTAVPEGPLDEEDKEVLGDPRVERAWALLSGAPVDGEPSWDWAEGVAEAANDGLARLVKTRRPG